MLFPAPVTTAPLFVSDRSAWELSVVFTVELLLPEFVSEVVVLTFAVLLMVEPLGADGDTCTRSVNVALAPAASEAMLQETVAPVVHVNVGPVFCVSETNVVFAGSVSDQAAFAAFDGPPLATVIV